MLHEKQVIVVRTIRTPFKYPLDFKLIIATPLGLRDDPPLIVEEEQTRHNPTIEGPSEPVQTRSRAKGKAP